MYRFNHSFFGSMRIFALVGVFVLSVACNGGGGGGSDTDTSPDTNPNEQDPTQDTSPVNTIPKWDTSADLSAEDINDLEQNGSYRLFSFLRSSNLKDVLSLEETANPKQRNVYMEASFTFVCAAGRGSVPGTRGLSYGYLAYGLYLATPSATSFTSEPLEMDHRVKITTSDNKVSVAESTPYDLLDGRESTFIASIGNALSLYYGSSDIPLFQHFLATGYYGDYTEALEKFREERAWFADLLADGNQWLVVYIEQSYGNALQGSEEVSPRVITLIWDKRNIAEHTNTVRNCPTDIL